jgi:hypothetical protein
MRDEHAAEFDRIERVGRPEAAHREPPPAFTSSRPMCASRSSARRIGVRDTPSRAAKGQFRQPITGSEPAMQEEFAEPHQRARRLRRNVGHPPSAHRFADA